MKKVASMLFCIAANAVMALPSSAASNYPERTVRLVVPSSAGSGADIIGRAVAKGLGERLGQAFFVDDKAGAGGNIAAEYVAKSPADGYTLFLVTSTFSANGGLYPDLPYDIQRDFAPVSLLLRNGPLVLVANPSFRARSVKQLIDLAHAEPGKIDFASAGIGNSLHLAAELFISKSKVNIVHVPYKGTGPALVALLSGEVPIMFASLSSARPYIVHQQLRALAVTSSHRTASLPEVPTMIEAGVPGYNDTLWYGILAPRAINPVIIGKLHDTLVEIMKDPAIVKSSSEDGLDASASTPRELAALLASEINTWSAVIRNAHISIK